MPKALRQTISQSEKSHYDSLFTLNLLPGFQPFLCVKPIFSPEEQEKIEQEFEQIVKTGCDQRVTLRGAMMFTNLYHAILQKVPEKLFQQLFEQNFHGAREALSITYKTFRFGTVIDYNLLLHSMVEGNGTLAYFIASKSQMDTWCINATHPTSPSACPLITAITMGYRGVARHMCNRATEESGLEHMQDDQGNSLLHLAIKTKDFSLFCSVFAKMGNTYDYENNENNDGLTPFDLATASDNKCYLKAFQEHKKTQTSSSQ